MIDMDPLTGALTIGILGIGACAIGATFCGIGYLAYKAAKKVVNLIKEKVFSKTKSNDKKENEKNDAKEKTQENNPEKKLKELKRKNEKQGFEFWQLNGISSNFENKALKTYLDKNIRVTKNPYRATFASNIIRHVEKTFGPEVANQITFDNVNYFASDKMYFNSQVFSEKLGHKVNIKTKLIEFRDKEYWFHDRISEEEKGSKYDDGKIAHFPIWNLGPALSILNRKLKSLGAKEITEKEYKAKIADKVRKREQQIRENKGYRRELLLNNIR